MSIFERNPNLRWAVPAVTAVVLVGGGTAAGGLRAIAGDGLPARTAAQLLVDVQQARLDGLSGTVVQKSDLGLPDLPIAGASGGAGSSSLTSLISGTHTMRVWFAGPDQARMALLGTLGESDVIRNGKDVWVWASQDKTARHYVLPAHDAAGYNKAAPGMPAPSDLPTSPQAAAEQALAAITPSTQVTTSGTATVAGRSAYELVLRPREATSLVAQVRVAIDGTEHVPLRVQVFAKSVADPVFEVAFLLPKCGDRRIPRLHDPANLVALNGGRRNQFVAPVPLLDRRVRLQEFLNGPVDIAWHHDHFQYEDG